MRRAGRTQRGLVTFRRLAVIGLEFQLAADVVRTAVSPSWQELGQLAVIAGIRTVLNLFLQRDLEGREFGKE